MYRLQSIHSAIIVSRGLKICFKIDGATIDWCPLYTVHKCQLWRVSDSFRTLKCPLYAGVPYGEVSTKAGFTVYGIDKSCEEL